MNIIDILRAAPSCLSFAERVKALRLSPALEQKVLDAETNLAQPTDSVHKRFLCENDEKELATEVLLCRHAFTCLVFSNRAFRQAALTVIQNVYLFQQRKIFFFSGGLTPEQERQEALLFFSQSPDNASLPLAKTLQHMILARIWDRIVSQASTPLLRSRSFLELHDVVEKLNSLRNIYMLLSTGLVSKLTTRISTIYRHSIAPEDARQIGSFGIARAAYRYHPSSGFRFSTYASRWVIKEIQRQSLQNRLIRISANRVEQFSLAARNQDHGAERSASLVLKNATAQLSTHEKPNLLEEKPSLLPGPEAFFEQRELNSILLQTIDTVLSPRTSDIIKRRYGVGCYHGHEQSAIELAKMYGVSRSSIYQREQAAMETLAKHLRQHIPSMNVKT